MKKTPRHDIARRDHYEELTSTIVRKARRGRAPLASPLGPEVRRQRRAHEPGHRPHLPRNQRACARHVAACVRRRSALDELQAGGGARLAGPQG